MIRLFILLLLFVFTFNNVKAQTTNSCVARFTYSIVLETSPLTVQFSNQSNCMANIQSWHWDFGDNESSIQENPQHQYFNEGQYVVKLLAIDNQNDSNTFIDTIKIMKPINGFCSAFFTYQPDTTSPNYSFNFYDYSISNNSSIIAWEWNFGDGSPTSSIKNPTHKYTNTGNYNVSLSILSIDSCSALVSQKIKISGQKKACSANFSFQENSLNYQFTNNSYTDNGNISYSWNFGDGSTSTSQNPNYQYSEDGIYNVKLKINSQTCTDSISIPLKVGVPQYYSMWGRVYVGNLTTDQCLAYLYRVYYNYIIPVDTVSLTSINDSLGIYYFYQVQQGKYIVNVRIPNTSSFHDDFCPTYYGDSPLWSESQPIVLYEDKSNLHINMTPVYQQTGNNYISGNVANNASCQINDILIFLVDNSGYIVDYTYTDSMGDYNFEDVSSGQFYLYCELAGFFTYPASTYYLNTNDSINNINFLIEDYISAYIPTKNISKHNNFSIYPNPTQGNNSFINFDKKTDEQYIYIITNSIGQLIKSGKLLRGNKGFIIDLQGTTKGMYFISIYDKNSKLIGTKKLIKQ